MEMIQPSSIKPKIQKCSICNIVGHYKSNRKFHPKNTVVPSTLCSETNIVSNVLDSIVSDVVKKNTEKKTKTKIINKGTGAGGANTNKNGKKFEEKTNNEPRLLEQGYEKVISKRGKCGYYLSKKMEDKTVVFVSQTGLKNYIKNKYNIVLFRQPDEAYIIEYKDRKPKILVLEKKVQNGTGSVDTKLLAGPIFKEEYLEAFEHTFDVEYAFCVNEYLQKIITSNQKKYIIFNKLMKKHNIPILFGDDANYFETLDNLINSTIIVTQNTVH
jgi:hypothetical protein